MSAFTMADAERVLKAFDGGMVRENDPSNPRGFTVFYKPQAAMLKALNTLSEQPE